MKMLVLIAVLVAVVWLMRGLRKPKLPPRPGQEAPPTATSTEAKQTHEEMISCQQCGVHLPRSEALPGRGGVFCCDAHRSAFESQQGI